MTLKELKGISEWFDRFVTCFQGEDLDAQRNYDLKIEHTKLVRANIERLSAAIGLSAEDQALAAAIAICHDVGRFPQFRDYGTFNDATSTNHAALAVQTLKNEGVLDELDERSRTTLLQSVALHNAFTLPEEMEPEVGRFVMLIRDADKLDIWRVLLEHCTAEPHKRPSAVTWGLPDTGVCSEPAMAEVAAGKMLQRSLLATADDFKLLLLSYVFDLNFDASFQLAVRQGYIGGLTRLLPCQPGCREVIDVVDTYFIARVAAI